MIAEWQPIETAPKDDVVIIVYDADLRKEERVQAAFWNDVVKQWQQLCDDYERPHKPTHWQPLPEPPAT